jgi:NitT/TauT family transport system substrate-binding protein
VRHRTIDTLRIVQRFHHLFYAPLAVLRHLDVLAQEGLHVEVITAATAAEPNDRLVDGTADIALGGPIRTLELAEASTPRRLVSFIEVNSRNGFFLLARQPQPQFQWADLVGRRLILFAEAPTPWLCLQHVLRRHGVDPKTVHVRQDLATADAVAAFLRGDADYLEQSQPVTESLISSGQAALVASEGDAVGPIPFSAYLTTPAFVASHAEVLRRFTRAVYRAQQWLARHPAEDVSELIGPAFADIAPLLRTRILDRYLRQQTWARDPLLRQEGFEHLQDILLGAGFITRRYRYSDQVDVTFAREAMA